MAERKDSYLALDVLLLAVLGAADVSAALQEAGLASEQLKKSAVQEVSGLQGQVAPRHAAAPAAGHAAQLLFLAAAPPGTPARLCAVLLQVRTRSGPQGGAAPVDSPSGDEQFESLTKYGMDLTANAAHLDPVIGRWVLAFCAGWAVLACRGVQQPCPHPMRQRSALRPVRRDEEIRRMVRILCRRTKNNPVLIGEPGVGKVRRRGCGAYP